MRHKKLLLFGILLIFAFSLSNVGTGYQSYNVKPGASMNYTYTGEYYKGKDQTYATMTWNDGTSSNVTLKAGTSFTITVCNITSNRSVSFLGQALYLKETFGNKTTSCGLSQDVFGALYVKYVNETYYTDLSKEATPNNIHYLLNGNNFTYERYITNGTFYINVTESWDLTTGWLTQIAGSSNYSNGTIVSSYAITATTLLSSTSTLKLTKTSPSFEFYQTVAVFVLVTTFVLTYRKRKSDK